MRVLQELISFYVYDSSIKFDTGKPEIVRREIKVLQEVIQEGASIPTYIVRYPDGRQAVVSRDMYELSQGAADAKLFQELQAAIIGIVENQQRLNDSLSQYMAALKLFT